MLVLVLSVTIVLVILVQLFKKKSNLPPIVSGRFPIIGHALKLSNLLKTGKQFPEVLHEIGCENNGICSLYLPNLSILITDPELIREVLCSESCNGRPIEEPGSFIHTLNGGVVGILNSNGSIWQQRRRVIMREIFKNNQLIQSIINQEMDHVFKSFFDSSEKEEIVDPSEELQRFANNIICRICLGDFFDRNDHVFGKKLTDFSGRYVAEILKPHFGDYFPLVNKLYKSPLQTAKSILNEMISLLSPIIEEHLKSFDPDSESRDIFDSLIRNKEKCHIQDSFYMMRILVELLVAGNETTTWSLVYFLGLMANHPDIQEKIYKEISSVVGNDRLVNQNDYSNLPYLKAAIKESARVKQVVPLLPAHMTTENTKIGPYDVPAGTNLIMLVDVLGKDKELFPNPEKFDPDRFVDDTEFNVSGKKSDFAPFGAGPHSCLGMRLAKQELFLIASNMIHCFKIESADPLGKPVDLTDVFYTTRRPKNPVKIKLIQRGVMKKFIHE